MIKFIMPTTLKWEEETPTYGKCVIEPLEKGYGVTIGNSLRRVLLSSIRGAAPTAVKFEGALHEFTTLPGVREDLVEIILNLKKLRFKLHGEGPYFIECEKEGPGVVTAKDLKLPSQVELLTPNQVIAHLEEGGKLEFQLRVDKGKGYVLAEDIQKELEISAAGWIALDADFSPVKKVAFHVSDARVGDKTDYNRLELEIWTDGSVTPKEALGEACKILTDHFTLIADKLCETKLETTSQKEKEGPSEEILNKTLEEAGLKGRPLKKLREAGILTVRDLIQKDMKEIEQIEGLGKKSLEEIRKFLVKLGLEVK